MDILTSFRYTKFAETISIFSKIEKESRKEAESILKRVFKNGVHTAGLNLINFKDVQPNSNDTVVYNVVDQSNNDHNECVQYKLGICTKNDCLSKCSDINNNIVTYPIVYNTFIIDEYDRLLFRIIVQKLPKYMAKLYNMLCELRLVAKIKNNSWIGFGETYVTG